MYTYNVFAYGFAPDEEKIIKKMLPTKESYLTSTDCFTDLIAINSYAMLINVSAVSFEEWDILWEYYLELEVVPETVVLVGDGIVPKKLKGKIQVYPDFETFREKLKYILLSAYRKSKKAETFSSTLANAILILSQIRLSPGVTTSQLAEKLELSNRSIQRYIESLRVAGEWIEYDRSLKGWTLTEGKSVLWGDLSN